MRITENYITEGGLSRLWQHTKDKNTFAVIGSQSSIDRVHRPDELKKLISEYALNHNGVGYNYILGNYKYKDGTSSNERSMIVYNIDKQAALDIASSLGQETILWKDPTFFGYIYVSDGSVDFEFENDKKNLAFNDKTFDNAGGSSQLVGKNWKRSGHNSEQEFVYEAYLQEYNRSNHSVDYYKLCADKVDVCGNVIPVFTLSEMLDELNKIGE